MNSDIGQKIIKILDEHSVKFEKIDKILSEHTLKFKKIDYRFEKIDSRFDKIDSRFDKIDSNSRRLEREFQKLIHKSNENHEQTRNDIGALMEFMTDRNQLIIEGFKSEADRIERKFDKKHDNHETRITTLEKVS